jgi:hypothetical protein
VPPNIGTHIGPPEIVMPFASRRDEMVSVMGVEKIRDRMGPSPIIQLLMRELAGYNLNAATGRLATLSEFETETLDS